MGHHIPTGRHTTIEPLTRPGPHSPAVSYMTGTLRHVREPRTMHPLARDVVLDVSILEKWRLVAQYLGEMAARWVLEK
jgi:hypothetical protein